MFEMLASIFVLFFETVFYITVKRFCCFRLWCGIFGRYSQSKSFVWLCVE